jgi:putative ABC transport system ATP-binding protein
MITLKDVSRTFLLGEESVHALRDVSLHIDRGEYLSIMGPSGSGKSTMLNILGLLDRPTTGTYELDGQDVTALSDDEQSRVRREKIGFVFQFFHLVPRLTAAENVELPLVLAGAHPDERREKVTRLLSEFGIARRAKHRPDQLSGGERQRVAIARAMIMEPAAILADEPTGNLDQHTGQEVLHLLEELNARGMTLVLITHDAVLGSRARRHIRTLDGTVTEERTRMT